MSDGLFDDLFDTGEDPVAGGVAVRASPADPFGLFQDLTTIDTIDPEKKKKKSPVDDLLTPLPAGTAASASPAAAPAPVPLSPRDVTATTADATTPNLAQRLHNASAVGQLEAAPARAVDAAESMAAHPLETAKGIVTAPLAAARDLGAYTYKAVAPTFGLPAPTGDEDISGTRAFESALALAALGAGPAIEAAAGPVVAGAATGAAFSPSDPAVGALVGGGFGAAHAGGSRAPLEDALDQLTTPAAAQARTPSITPSITSTDAAPWGFRPAESPAIAPTRVALAAARAPDPSTDIFADLVTGPGAGHLAEARPRSVSTAPVGVQEPPNVAAEPRAATAAAVPGVELRYAGLPNPLDTELGKTVQTQATMALSDIYAPIRDLDPDLHATLHAAGAMPPTSASRFVGGLADRSLAGLTASQVELFGRRTLQANLEAEAVRKQAAATDALAQGPTAAPRAQLLQVAADRFKAHAAAVAATVPQDLHTRPWFQRAADQVRQNVEGFTEAAAAPAGVDPSTFRRPEYAPGVPAPYMRLLSQERLNEQNIRGIQGAAANESTVPRTGKALAVFGQRPVVERFTPAGASGPVQGPENVAREQPAPRNVPPGTAASGSRLGATGRARHYVSDFATAARADAADKVAKAQRNAVYQAIAKIPGAELAPDRNAGAGTRVLMFNDLHQLVPPPPAGSAAPAGFRRFAVPSAVADAVEQYQKQMGGKAGPPTALRRGASVVTRSVLLNPAAAGGHALTLASSVGTGLPADAGAARALLSGVPGVKVASTLQRFQDVDFSDPGTVARLHRLALSGALRIAPDESRGWINQGHHILFGPSGIDPRARVVASEDFEAQAKKGGVPVTDPAYAALERDYVNGHAGNYVGRNSGSASQFLQDSGVTPFLAINRAKYGTAFRSLVGASDVPTSALDRGLTALRGPVGVAAALAGAGYLLSGHPSTDNAQGHEGDLATGVYQVPGKDGQYHPLDLSSYTYFRGNPDAAASALGRDAKEVYLRKGFLDPTSAAALRILEPIAYAPKGDKVGELVRNAANAALALVGPAPAMAWTGLTGRTLYQDPDGNLGSVQGIHLSKDAGLVDRIAAVARQVNAGAAMAVPPTAGTEQRSTASSVLGNLNPFVEGKAGQAPREARERFEERTWYADVLTRIGQASDVDAKQKVADAALQEARAKGYDGPTIQTGLAKAVQRVKADRTLQLEDLFDRHVRGRAP